jgi:hypothetical protein
MQPRIIERLRGEERKLQERLMGELDAIEEYQLMLKHQCEMEKAEDYCEFKAMMLRKLYHYIRRHHPEHRKELKERLFVECQAFFEGEFNMKLMIKFIRSKLEGIQ